MSNQTEPNSSKDRLAIRPVGLFCSHVLALAQQANAMAEAEWKTPDWIPQSIRDGMKEITALNMAAAKRNALGDLLGFSREFQKNVPIFLDKVLADAEDIARWESMTPEVRQAFQSKLDEKKHDLQWLEDYLAKMEEPSGEQKLAADSVHEERARLTAPSAERKIEGTKPEAKRCLAKARKPKLSKQEGAQVRTAYMLKYGGKEGADLPAMGYIFAHDHFYIVRNYGASSYEVMIRLDPVMDAVEIDEIIRRFKDEDSEEFSRLDWEGPTKRQRDTGGRDSSIVDPGD